MSFHCRARHVWGVELDRLSGWNEVALCGMQNWVGSNGNHHVKAM